MIGRRIALNIALAALALPCVAQAAPPSTPSFQDSATGSGSSVVFQNFDFDVSSGPSGENPTGPSSTNYGGFNFVTTSITCLNVRGNQATFGGPVEPNPFGYKFGRVTVTDNGPPGSNLDTYAGRGDSGPLDCRTPEISLMSTLTSGDVVVHDSAPPPTSKSQCKKGGWADYGFRNQGQCVAFVERRAKP